MPASIWPRRRFLSFTLSLFSLFPAVHTWGQGCDPELLTGMGGECYSVAEGNGYLYLVEGRSLTVLQTSPGSDPVPVGRLALPFDAFDIALSGTQVALTGSNFDEGEPSTRFALADVSVPSAPVLQGIIPLSNYANDVSLSGDRACVAYGSTGLQMIDTSNPSLPVPRGSYDTPGQPYEIVLSGNLIYVADSFQNLLVLDASDPDSIAPKGSLPFPGGDSPSLLTLSGNLLYVVDYFPNLRVVDVTNPAVPTLRGTLELKGYPKALAASGHYVYAANNRAEVAIADVSTVTAPVLDTTATLVAEVKELAAVGDRVFAVVTPNDYPVEGAGYNGIEVLDVSNPSEPADVGSYRTPKAPVRLLASEGTLFAEDQIHYTRTVLNLLDITQARSPVLLSQIDLLDQVYEIERSGDLVFVDHYPEGIEILDVFDLKSPVRRTYLETPGRANDISIAGSRLFVADGEAGLQIYDISDPSHPQPVGSWPTTDYADSVVASGDLAYVEDSQGLHILDVSDPKQVTPVGTLPTFPRVLDLKLENGVIVGNRFDNFLSGVQIADVSNPAVPILKGLWDGSPGYYTQNLALSRSHAFLGVYGVGLRVVDISNPALPVQCGSFDDSGDVHYLALEGGCLFMTRTDASASGGGILVFSLPCIPSPDVNGDGTINNKDLLRIVGKWHQEFSCPSPEDINCDGVVDRTDVVEFQESWRTTASGR